MNVLISSLSQVIKLFSSKRRLVEAAGAAEEEEVGAEAAGERKMVRRRGLAETKMGSGLQRKRQTCLALFATRKAIWPENAPTESRSSNRKRPVCRNLKPEVLCVFLIQIETK